MPDNTDSQIASAQEAYGFERLGPVIAYYLHDLNAVLERLSSQRRGVSLFVSRGGLLIGRALQVYREAASFTAPALERPLYVSRFLAAKGAWKRAQPAALAMLDSELHAGTATDYLRRIAPGQAAEAESKITFASFTDFMASDDAAAMICANELERQAELFEAYFRRLMGEAQLGTLIDTGWRGTILSLLTKTFPDYELWGANFGRYGYSEIDPRIFARLIGVGFDSNGYDPEKPLTALLHHRHLIEALFEPVGPSIERVVQQGEEVVPVGADEFSPAHLRPGQPTFFKGLLRYLREVAPGLSYSRLVGVAHEAAQALSADVLFPSAETARVLGAQRRSVDFGSAESVPVTIEPKGQRDLTPEQRITRALWTQGQIALECRPAIARERQRALVSKTRAAVASQTDPFRKEPKVAIVMRTMDRMIFLNRAFESIVRQTYDDYVLVVFNDGGDVSGVEAELQRSRLDRRKVVLVDGIENRGMEAASNAAIRAVSSEYVVIHDDDDSWDAAFLQQTVRFLDADPRIGGVVTRSYRVDEEISGDRVLARKRVNYNEWLRSVQLGELIMGNFFPPISFLFRRRVYDEIGGFNEQLPVLGDWDFNLRFAAKAEIGVIPQPLANYHMRVGGGGGTYDNSVTGAISLHERFNTVVRSGLANDEKYRAIGGAMVMAPVLLELRQQLRQLRTATAGQNAPESGVVALADERWCMLEYLMATGSSERGKVTPALALAHARAHGVAIPPDFDEEGYLRANSDVRAAVEQKVFSSGYVHYVLCGRSEGRRRTTRLTSPGT